MDERGLTTSKPIENNTAIFEECCPFYLSIGMTYDEYWNGNNDLPKHARKAYKMRQEQMNYEAWLKGLYMYDAFGSVMSQMFSKDKNSHKQYAEKPYSFDPEKIEEEEVMEAEAQAEVWLKSWVAATQQMFKNE